MLVIDVELLHSGVRAAAGGDTVITGNIGQGEWPLSPARLFSAFVAADGTGDRCRLTDGGELQLLSSAAPPRLYADEPRHVCVDPLRDRYVVVDATQKGTTQGYPARKAALHRAGARASPRTPRLVYVWEGVEPTPNQLTALRLRAARIPYVGCADSPARVRVTSTVPADLPPCWEPGRPGTTLPVPYEGFLEALDARYADEATGRPVRRSWVPSEVVEYGLADRIGPQPSGTLSVISLDEPLPGHQALRLTTALRDAVLSHAGDAAPAILHGHGLSGKGHLQARYLALPFAGARHADGRIRGAAVWLPADTESSTVRVVRAALLAIRELRGRGMAPRRCVPVEPGVQTLRTLRPSSWTAPHGARRWCTVTPVVHERHVTPGLAEVRRWFRHAGHPEPSAFRRLRSPLVPGGAAMRPSDLRPRYATDRFDHLEVTFDTPVAGPLVVGRGRQFGLGLLMPVPDHGIARGGGG